ncbi:MAG: hypothetical protein LIO93_08060 [Bacteroidales bacterium]|nr:hypothetical protein [Bacteroidales bacterium]
MKKLFGLILLVGLFASCEGPTGPPGRDGIGADSFIRDVKISWNMWEEGSDATGPILFYEIREPRLTNYVLNNAVSMQTFYRYRLDNSDNDRYVPLSYSDFWAEREEYFTVEYTLGYITISYKTSDASEVPEFEDYDFQVRVTW